MAVSLTALLISIRDDKAGASGLFHARTPAAAVSASPLERLAAAHPARPVEVIVQLRPGHSAAEGRRVVESAGGRVTRELPLVEGLGAELPAGRAAALADDPAVRAVSPNGRVESTYGGGLTTSRLKTAFNESVGAPALWFRGDRHTGKGVGIAVLDTGIDGSLVDFRVSEKDPRSRVIASAVTSPAATSAEDRYGHGTHVAGLIAGNGSYRASKDKLDGRYAGIAPDANLISVKVSDEEGVATVMDVIDGLQFVLDHKDRFGIRVVNLSLNSTHAESYRTDPLDAAVEEAWFRGLVVVAAAGNRGAAGEAVSYAPGNDPYVITVGGVDDRGTKRVGDDSLADWSSRGTTQDGVRKPEVLAPGAHMISTLAAGSDFARECPTCVRDGEYFQVGGTSMATGVVSGTVALLLEEHPEWTPDQVKGALIHKLRDVPGVGGEVSVERAAGASRTDLLANEGLSPSTLFDPSTGTLDPARARWSRARWSHATGLLRARWSAASFACAQCTGRPDADQVEETRARWSRARWSTSYTK